MDQTLYGWCACGIHYLVRIKHFEFVSGASNDNGDAKYDYLLECVVSFFALLKCDNNCSIMLKFIMNHRRNKTLNLELVNKRQ